LERPAKNLREFSFRLGPDVALIDCMPGKYIDGVYAYCDGWHERCRFQNQCRLYRSIALRETALQQGLDRERASAWIAERERESEQEEEATHAREEAANPALARQRAEFLETIAEANRPPTAEESARFDAMEERQRTFRETHPLSMAAREYMDLAVGTMEVLRALLEARADPVSLAAVDTIGRFAGLIGVKTYRAVGALAPTFPDDGLDDDEFKRSDGDGCAKLVRLIVAESRDAWQVLMQAGTAAADGVPAAMVRRLEALDVELASAFPRAMAFVRPGLDEAEPPS
jgi:hypothetical protein